MFRIPLTFAMMLCVASCASTVSDTLEATPAWFEERKADLSHEGYPDFALAAQVDAENETIPWSSIRQDLVDATADFEANDPGPVTITAEEMRAWAEEQIRLVDKGEEPY